MLKLTEEEQVFAKQLFDVRHTLAKLKVEEATQLDRLLTILRGHNTKAAEGGGYLVSRLEYSTREDILVTHHGMHPDK